jgi:cell wall-associated NlpC family hydrolase
MTIRHTLTATVLTVAVAFGCAAIPASAQAAPAAVVAPLSVAISGNDGLAVYARAALDEWASVATGKGNSLTSFASYRDAIAGEAARRLMLDPAVMQAAWRAADLSHQVALMAAFSQVGTPYRRNAAQPGVGLDCSGLTSWSWAQAGKILARQSGSQIRAAKAVTRDTAQAGDLVYYPGHVMMYLGVDNAIIHSPFTGRTVEVGFVSKRKAGSARFGNPIG